MAEDRPDIIVVPTEMERQDAFYDGAALAATILVVWWLSLQGMFLVGVPLMVIVGVLTLTGEPAADVPYLGAVASGLRSRFGLRRAHEWLGAWAHYFRVRQWPDFKMWMRATRASLVTRFHASSY